MLLTLISAKGSPGVTTSAAALAAIGALDRAAQGVNQGVDLVELDPSGGDIEPLTGVTGESGLLGAASDLRVEALPEHTVQAPRGVRSLLAPTSSREANATVVAALEGWGAALSILDGIAVVDGGRWEAAQPAADRLSGSDLVAMVCRPDARGVEHVRHIASDVRAAVYPAPVVLVTVGDQPYKVGEVAEAINVPGCGALAWDPRGATALWGEGVGERRFMRWPSSWLARSARGVLAELVHAASGVATR